MNLPSDWQSPDWGTQPWHRYVSEAWQIEWENIADERKRAKASEALTASISEEAQARRKAIHVIN